MQKTSKRVLALVLAFVMVISVFSISASAYNAQFVSDTHDVFRHTTQTLAPGVEYYNNYAYLKDGEQIVYYAAVADINRDDVVVQGGYWNEQTEQYGMAKLTEQVAAANAKFSDPNNEDFISENYTVVAGTNGDFYNMQTGRPSGAFAINGHIMNDANNRPWFAVFADGTALCGANDTDYNAAIAAHGAVQNSVGGSQMLVADGQDVTANASGSYNTDRHSRTMIGVTADNKVVSVVLDGRQSPFSIGGSMHELAQIMLEAECVTAINLDGGGSTTFGARPEGEDSFRVINRPSDGSERSISSGVLIASLAAPSTDFDHVAFSVADDYVTPGTSTTFTATGVSTSGASAEIPAAITYVAENGSIDGNTVTAGAEGEVVVKAMLNGEEVGSATFNAVIPDTIAFAQETFTVPYGKTVDLGITAKYGLNTVKTKTADFDYVLETASGAGEIVDGAIVAPAEDAEATGNTVTATMIADNTKTTTAHIAFGKASVVLFDFEDGTTQKWVRYNTNNYNYIHTRGTTSNVTAENGQVHSGEHALKLEAKFSETWEAGYVSGRAGVYGLDEIIDLKGATRIGMWMYIPVADASFNGRIFMCKVTERDEETGAITKYEGYYTDSKIDTGGDWNCGFVTQYDEPGWHYVYFDLSTDTDWCIIKNHSLLDFYINDRNGDSYGYNHLDYTNGNADLNLYIDDVTVDYSSVIEDRDRPEFTEVKLGDEGNYSNEGLVLARGSNYVSDGYNKIDLSARVIDHAAANATGLNADTAKVYLDGVEFPCTFNNGIITAPTYTYTNGEHTVKFAIEDNAGNYASAIRTFTVTNTANDQPVWIEAKDPSLDKILLGSLYWVNVKAADASAVSAVDVDLDLDNLSKWELDHMEVAQGFDASYEIINADENIACLTITRNSDNIALLDGDAIVSMPIRTWELPAVAANYGHAGVVWMYNKYRAGNEVWPVNVIVKASAGQVTFSDNSTEIFTGDEVNVRTESIYWDNDNAKASDEYYKNWNGGHDHRPETAQYYDAGTTNHVDVVALPDIAPTCTEPGLTGKTFCEVCNSVVDWGTVVPATGHHYEVNADGKLACKDCNEIFNGVYEEDGKLYEDGVPAEGWRNDNTNYYIDGLKIKDAAYVIDGDPYVFDADGNVSAEGLDNYAGLVYDLDTDDIYFVALGNYKTAWQTNGNDYYYFSKEDYKALKGEQVINGHEYTFSDKGVLLEGSFYNDNGKIRYAWAGNAYNKGWLEVEGKTYYGDINGVILTGVQRIETASNSHIFNYYLFDETGALVEGDGFVDYNGTTYYMIDNILNYAGLIEVDGAYYYVRSDYTLVKNAEHYVYKTNDLMEIGTYEFDADGKMVIPEEPQPDPEKNGFYDEDGKTYYYVDGEKTYAGLIEVNGAYYYVKSDCSVVKDCSYFVWTTNDLMDQDWYDFDADGKMIIPGEEPTETPTENPDAGKNGLVDEDGVTYYYVDGVKTYAGLIQIDGDYYYVKSNCTVVKDCSYFVWTTNGLMDQGYYDFDADGKMIIPGEEPTETPTENPDAGKNGLVDEDGVTYYYVDGVKTYAGLIQIDGDYYYVKSNCTVVKDCDYFVWTTNGLMDQGWHSFGADGKMILD